MRKGHSVTRRLGPNRPEKSAGVAPPAGEGLCLPTPQRFACRQAATAAS
ncbi:hypothetical protein BN2364_3396 [Alloalcanivorax xenomutans]|nr:hypothetical protein BN2364_3396 [Alloalcanivorax xenomutans]